MIIDLLFKARLSILILNKKILRTKMHILPNKTTGRIIDALVITTDGKLPLFISIHEPYDIKTTIRIIDDGEWYIMRSINLFRLKRMVKNPDYLIDRLRIEYGFKKWEILDKYEEFFLMYLLLHFILRLGDDSNILKKFNQRLSNKK